MKKGDTLIEVTLAVGIFSMIAVAITAVMSSGTAGAQTALETTLTREEIDTQAEAIRFIQTTYSVNKNATENNKTYKLWREQIIDHAIDMKGWTEERQEAVLQYHPDNCLDLYSNADIKDHAFVINPRQLGNYLDVTKNLEPDSVYIPYSSDKLTQATVYPRLVYGTTQNAANTEAQKMYTTSNNTNLYHAEGIYVLAVKDVDTTNLTVNSTKEPAFYDFYIRTCWYGTDANQPSTISTVIRLHNPDAI